LAAAEDFEGPRLQQAIGADRPKKNRTHKRIRVEEGAIDRGKIMKLARAPMLVKERGRDQNQRAEVNRAEFCRNPESNQRQKH